MAGHTEINTHMIIRKVCSGEQDIRDQDKRVGLRRYAVSIIVFQGMKKWERYIIYVFYKDHPVMDFKEIAVDGRQHGTLHNHVTCVENVVMYISTRRCV